MAPKIEMKLELIAFPVPNFVRLKGLKTEAPMKINEDMVLSLKEVPAKTLAEMCCDFRKEIFEKAGKQDPGDGANGL